MAKNTSKKVGGVANKRAELLDRIKSKTHLSGMNLLSETTALDLKTTNCRIPIINIAFSGSIYQGFSQGVHIFAGPSKHFKTLFGLIMVAAYLKENPDAICIFYDSEFGASKKYFASLGIPEDRVVHCPVFSIEELKNEMVTQLQHLTNEDDVIMFTDSLGNLASKKEIEDAINDKAVADMTRSKANKSLFRMVTPHIQFKKIPAIFICHTYDTMDMFPKKIVSGGQGQYFAAQNIFIVSRAQEKEGKTLSGYSFSLNVEKSRRLKEKSKLEVEVTFDDGINPWSGMLALATELGYVTNVGMGRYVRNHIQDDKKHLEAETNTVQFWKPILQIPQFHEDIKNMFCLSETELIRERENEAELMELMTAGGEDDE